MKVRFCVLLALAVSCTHLLGVKGTEAHGEQPVFSGVLKSQEGNLFHCTNIVVGRSATSHDKITLYEMPKDMKASAKGNRIPVNPTEALTTAQLELLKVSKIEVPNPRTLWHWVNPEKPSGLKREYIEVIVTWKSGTPIHYLLELGPAETKRPIKLYCDASTKPIKGIRQEGTLFCANINKEDLRRKGAPFPSIKSLELDEPCFKLPKENVQPAKPAAKK